MSPAKKDDNRAIRLRILDKEVQLACAPGEEDDLMQAAAHVQQAMRELRARNTTSSIEKLAIVVAINTASALLKARAGEAEQQDAAERLSRANERLKPLLEER